MRLSIVSLILILILSSCLSPGQSNTGIQEEKKDLLGFYKKSNSYSFVIKEKGGTVVNLYDKGTYFVVWVPENYNDQPVKRVMVVIHGTVDPEGPKGYAEEKDEIPWAEKYGYAVVGIQWWLNKETEYLSAEKVYDIIEIALTYMEETYQSDINKSALIGFSRGSELSYELTFIDKYRNNNFFALTICHSGHLLFSRPTPFVQRLFNGEYGNDAYSGKHFFLYCGMKDEEWQEEQCRSMEVSRSSIEKYGAVIDEYISDGNGKHFGFRENTQINQSAIELFMHLTTTQN